MDAQAQSPLLMLTTRLRTGVCFCETMPTAKYSVLEDVVGGKYYRVGRVERRFIGCFEQQVSVADAIAETCASHPNEFNESTGIQIVSWLASIDLIEMPAALRAAMQFGGLGSGPATSKPMGILNPISFRIRLGSPDRLIKALYPIANRVFAKSAVAVWSLLI